MADVNNGHEENNTDQEGLYDVDGDGEDGQEDKLEDEQEERVESRRKEKGKAKARGGRRTAGAAEKHKAKGKGKASGLATPRRRVTVLPLLPLRGLLSFTVTHAAMPTPKDGYS